MEEERVVLKQQKSSAKFAVCLEFNTQIPRPFGGLLFYTVKGRHTATWAFQRTMYTDTVPMHAAAATLLISSTCPDLRAMRTPSDAREMDAWGEELPRCTCANSQLCRQTTHIRAIFPARLFLPHKLFSPVWGTKPAVERFSKSALLRRRKRYFNSAVNKFCPFTCVRNTLNKLRFQDLAPQHWPNKSRHTAPGEGRGPRGKHIYTR